jgi:hypothetical protein
MARNKTVGCVEAFRRSMLAMIDKGEPTGNSAPASNVSNEPMRF